MILITMFTVIIMILSIILIIAQRDANSSEADAYLESMFYIAEADNEEE